MFFNFLFGVSWKKVLKIIKKEVEDKGMSGCFGVGMLRIYDGFLFFLQYMILKMKLNGSCIGIVFNGFFLFIGAVESGESNI